MAHTDSHGHGQHAHDAHNNGANVEHSDADVSGVGKTLVFTGVFVALCFLIVLFMFGGLQRAAAARDPQLSQAVPRQGDRQPAVPRLQVRPIDDLTAFRAAQHEALSAWGWADAGHSVARVPVERAMEIMAEKGLPAVAALPAPVAAPEGVSAPAASAPAPVAH